jgi:endoglucanase
MGRVYGSVEGAAALAKDVEKVRAYIARTSKTPFMGEFGANELIGAEQRTLYYKKIRTGFDAVGIGQCAWGYTNTFPLYDSTRKHWNEGMLPAGPWSMPIFLPSIDGIDTDLFFDDDG